MDYEYQGFNGWDSTTVESDSHHSAHDERKRRNYKLLSDPMIEPGAPKIYRFDGVVQGELNPEPIFLRDPRSRMKRWNKRAEPMEIPVPKFKFDSYYVGTILPKEVTFTNLNDNINHDFLRQMCATFGVVEEAKVYFHPRTKKHLGIGKALFTSTRCARVCAEKLNNTSKMGMLINAFVDPFGKDRVKLVEELTAEKAQPPPPQPAPMSTPRPPSPPTPQKSHNSDDPRRRSSGSRDRHSHHRNNRDRSDYRHDSSSHHSHRNDHRSHDNSSNNHSHHRDSDSDRYGNALPGMPPVPPTIPPLVNELAPPLPDLDSRHSSDMGDYEDSRRSHHRGSRDRGHRNRRDEYPVDYEDARDMDYGSYNEEPSSHHNKEYGYDDRYSESHSRHSGRRDRRSSSRRHDYDDESYDKYQSRDRRRDNDRHKSRNRQSGGEGDRYQKDKRHHRRDRDEQDPRHSPDRRYERDHDISGPPLPPRHERHDSMTSLPPEPPIEPSEAPPEPPETPVNEDAPRLDLDSRISALLGGFASSPTHDEPPPEEGPPLPDEGGPPLPPEDAPPLPDEPAPPPLPPEPEEHFTNGHLESKMVHFAQMFMPNGFNASGPVPKGLGGHDDDDRMSMSSIGSEEKIELAPTHMPPPGPPMPPMPPLIWPPPTSGPPPPTHNQAFQNHITNTMYNQGFPPPQSGFMDPVQQAIMQQMCPPGFGAAPSGPVFTEMDEKREECFIDVLDNIISQLKMIMKKDLCKKMVQETAFRTYDDWLESENQRNQESKADKEVPFSQYSAVSKDSTPTTSEAAGTTASTTATTTTTTSTSAPPPKPKPTDGMGSAIAALFERKDGVHGPAFGMGGLLGFCGIPKMPSFRKKFIKPPTPPPEEDEEEDEDEEKEQDSYVGPRTPEESDDEDKMSEGSMSESDLRSIKERQKKRTAIYSSDSSEASDDDEYEDSDEEKAGSESEGSDIDIEGSPTKAPSPVQPKKRRNKFQRRAEEEPSSGIAIERATFPLGGSDAEESQDSQVSAITSESELSDLGNVDSDAASDHTPVPSDAEDMVTSDGDKRAAEEEDVAMALLRMHEVSAEEKEKQRQREEVLRISRENVAREHCYLYKGDYKSRPRNPLPEFNDIESDMTDSASEGEPDMIPCLPSEIGHDHQYCTLYHPIDYAEQYRKTRTKFLGSETHPEDYYSEPVKVEITDIAADMDISTGEVIKKYVNRVTKRSKGLSDITNLKGSRELASLLPEVEKPKAKFKARTREEQVQISYEFLVKGIDSEDRNFLKRRYEELLQDDSPRTAWLNNVHWVEHTHTQISDPPVKKRRKAEEELPKHETGSARTEGFYHITHAQRKTYLRHAIGVNAYNEDANLENILARIEKSRKQKNQQARDSRSESRRLQTELSKLGGHVSDLVKFNQLKFRKKEVKFAKSGIHHWGLFALEHIEEDTMVIEYVGQKVRQTIADLREKRYEQQGIGSSYLFRIDSDDVVDATKYGGVARFINHSCNPNCYAKIITVEGEKKIVIYSKRDIKVNEEITYDYKFPLEDEKIPCLCSSISCRGSLN